MYADDRDRPPGEPAGSRPTGPTSARTMAAYLTALRALINEASESRRSWVRQIGTLMQDARTKPPEMVATPIGEVGRGQRAVFTDIRDRALALSVPPECITCQETVVGWLDKQMAACDIMVEVGSSGDVGRLRQTQGLLAEGRVDTMRFNAEYTALVETLRARVNRATRRPARRAGLWPFGKRPGRSIWSGPRAPPDP